MDSKARDRISSIFWFLVAISICFGSFRLNLGDYYKPGPGFFSFLAEAILAILALLVFLKSFKTLLKEERRAFWPDPQRRLKVTLVIVALIFYAVGMIYIGFFFSTLLFIGFLMRAIYPQSWKTVIGWSFLAAVASYGLFKYLLDVQLPVGIIGF